MTTGTTAASTLHDLAGTWTAVLDPHGVGERESWFARDLSAAESSAEVQLPGSVQAQGLGAAPDVATEWVGAAVDHPFYSDERYAPYRRSGALKVPFFLQPERVFTGQVWYQRTIEIAGDARSHELTLERVHWESTVWIDDERLGSQRSLSTPHRFVLPPALAPGHHRLTIRVDNSMIVDVGTNAHSVTDHTQGSWNGVIGTITLRPIEPVRLERLSVHPDIATRSITVTTSILADSVDGFEGTLTLESRPLGDPASTPPASLRLQIAVAPERFRRGRATSGTHLDTVLPLGEDAPLWDEFDPALHRLTATLETHSAAGHAVHTRSTVFGLREVTVSGTHIQVNGRPVFLRGALECCVFPLTGYPPTDRQSWDRLLSTCRAYGLNHLRFHSWCPPAAAFEAADAAGMYLQIEGPIWANQGAAIGEGRDVDTYLEEETRRIVDEFGDHPSFLLMAHGNEPAGRDAEFLGDWVATWRRRDPRRLYTTAGGWPALSVSDFDCIPEPRLQAWGEGLDSRINATPPATTADYSAWVERTPRPIVTHEAGQWCAHPDVDAIASYTGVMRPTALEIVRDFLQQSELLDQSADLVHASGRLQLLCYKEEIEAALRTPGFGGIQLLGLSDFPGQGTAPVGVLDAFWEDKGYTTAAEFSRFFAPTVPLALLPRRTFAVGDEVEAEVRVAHFGPQPLDAEIAWQLVGDDGSVVSAGALEPQTIAAGGVHSAGRMTAPLDGITTAQRLRLVIAVGDRSPEGGGRVAENDWEIWVYPPIGDAELDPGDTLVTRDVEEALSALSSGSTVLLVPEDAPSPVAFGFSPVFWNTSWTNGQAPHTLGILCDPQHPALAGFPTDPHTNWQWWELLHGAKALDLTALGARARPIVQVIDSWFDARRLGLLLEARVGAGRLLLCTLDVVNGLDERAVARRLRVSLQRHLLRADVEPGFELAPAELRTLLHRSGPADLNG
ncbi:sugar-binding domain-containing protein [Rathayibacter sp. VKM Ac-2760]|uniref:sugar-binding domain-containing protein n=1 Tax=Rathayibacter sp. VKM Ac-2760 TaxID=2609253 RepID=UPI001319496C|nr:sugar-binding domain-containing protein [Rathayibacter sp. VKM Ac-2760]QHC58730.1 glycoside hydrolase [Rathayibacter sp. VKM Ac-2760]